MNTPSDTLPNGAEENEEPAAEEARAARDAALIELGKVSETNGGWWGVKLDSGAGFTIY